MPVPRRLNSYLATSLELREFAHKTQELAALQRQYRLLAPSTMASASQVIGFERQVLIIGACNSAIAAKLRQLAPQFVQMFQGSGAKVTGIRVRVQVANQPPVRKLPHPPLGAAGRQHMKDLAENLPDSPLKQAVQRLAKGY
jgi:hypothetical protein